MTQFHRLKHQLQSGYNLIHKFYIEIAKALISPTLKSTKTTNTKPSEQDFGTLQSRYAPRPEYGYDYLSTWKRAYFRTMKILDLGICGEPGQKILDIGTGDGMLGVALESYGHLVYLTDLNDWRDPRAKKLQFSKSNCCQQLPYEDNSFDLVVSFNSFEHFHDPAQALSEARRVTKPGGLIHLDFGPLYSSPWGLHAYRSLLMPYPQFLFSETFVERKLKEIGIRDLGTTRTSLQFVNKYSVRDFEMLWKSESLGKLNCEFSFDYTGLPLVLKYPEAFRGRGLTFEDITTSAISITLQKLK